MKKAERSEEDTLRTEYKRSDFEGPMARGKYAKRSKRRKGAFPRESSLDPAGEKWDHPTMTTIADSKKRVVLPKVKPGDVFDVQQQGEGRYLLVRLERPAPVKRMTKAQCLRAIAAHPLRLTMTWDELKALTREP